MNKDSQELLERALELSEKDEDTKVEVRVTNLKWYEKFIGWMLFGSLFLFFGGLGAFFWARVYQIFFGS